MTTNFSRLKIIVAALDWGLGHASRMIPIIEYFLRKDYQVAIASSGNALKLLQNRFPDLLSFELSSYNIEYKHSSMVWEMTRQLPKIFKVRNTENQQLKRILNDFDADLIISDNRYGFYNKKIKSIFITHQLQILGPKSFSFINPILKKLHIRLLSRFEQIWVPDFYGSNSLAGVLSNVDNISANIKYIGPLSRFYKVKSNSSNVLNEINNIVVILSGPEPARTIFENKIIFQLEDFNGKLVLLRGVPNNKEVIINDRIEVYNHLNDDKLLPILQEADVVISRSGYSSLMDMYFLSKKSIFIPTKGQTEQEYLAERFMSKKMFYSQKEENLDLKLALSEVKKYSGFVDKQNISFDIIDKALEELGF